MRKRTIGLLLCSLMLGAFAFQPPVYGWERGTVKQDYHSRQQLINETLDSFEGNKPVPPPPRKKRNLDYFFDLPEQEPTPEPEKEKEVESWLRREHPFFYEDYMEKQRAAAYKSDISQSKMYNFLKNIDYGLIMQTDAKPQYYLETVFPLHQSEDLKHTFFSHDRLSAQRGGGPTYSVGLGYRYYDKELAYIFGANTFFDYQQEMGHYRMGLGGELIGDHGEVRVNYYNALSDAQRDGDFLEQAVDGFDVELGTRVPGIPLAKIFGGYQWYDYRLQDDVQGWTTRLEVRPVSFMKLNAKIIDENGRDRIYRLDGLVNFDFTSFAPEDIAYDLQGEPIEERPRDLVYRLLDRVEREFEVRAERWHAPLEDDDTPPGPPPVYTVLLEVRFPGVQCGPCVDSNLNGIVDPGEGFELDVVLTNGSTMVLTGITATNVVLSNPAMFANVNSGSPGLPDAGPGQTVRTDPLTDQDIAVNPAAVAGDATFVTIDITVNGDTQTFSFGPFTVGSVMNGQQFPSL